MSNKDRPTYYPHTASIDQLTNYQSNTNTMQHLDSIQNIDLSIDIYIQCIFRELIKVFCHDPFYWLDSSRTTVQCPASRLTHLSTYSGHTTMCYLACRNHRHAGGLSFILWQGDNWKNTLLCKTSTTPSSEMTHGPYFPEEYRKCVLIRIVGRYSQNYKIGYLDNHRIYIS